MSSQECNSSETYILRDSTKIHGTLFQPISSSEFPVVIIIAGSGPTDRDGNNSFMQNNSLKMLAEGLCANGIASVRYDKRGILNSVSVGMKEDELRFEDYILDAEEWVKKIKTEFPKSNVFIAGHSEGSLIGMVTSVKSEVTGFISIAGIGRTADMVIEEQLAVQPPQLLDLALPILDSLRNGITVDTINPFLFSLFRPSIQPYLISWFKYDPQKHMQYLKIPTLILQGDTDIQVKVKDAELLHEVASKSRLQIISSMNHILKSAPLDRTENVRTYSDPELPLHPELIPAMVQFIMENGQN